MKKRMTILDKAEMAMKEAVKKVITQHKKSGQPIVVWKDGKVRKIKVK